MTTGERAEEQPADGGGSPLPRHRGLAAALAALGSVLVLPSLLLPSTAVRWQADGSSAPLFEQWLTGRVRWSTQPAAWLGAAPPHGADAADSVMALGLLVASALAGMAAGVLWWRARSRGRLAAAATTTLLALALYLGGVTAGSREVPFSVAAASGTPVASVTPAGVLGVVAMALWAAALTLMLWQLRRPRATAPEVASGA